jgi:demethylmenaquinone methyltransferase / 2-methoxy-6-polyprenyl-1,4-benzoquinol methylase
VSEQMLAVGRTKVQAQQLQHKVVLQQHDLQHLPAAAFDVVTISFGIRNVMDTVAGLRALHGSLKPGGTLLVLEFGEPTSAWFGPLYRWYRKHILPRIAGAVSGQTFAYEYLDETIASFPSRDGFLALTAQAGFAPVRFSELTMGSVMLYEARRPA